MKDVSGTPTITITAKEIEAIMKTLPISFYTKRKTTIELTNDKESSFDPREEVIRISLPSLSQNLTKKPIRESRLYDLTKGLLYHETAHSILSPVDFPIENSLYDRAILHTFEDERVETLLNGTFYGVNFKKNLYELEHFRGEEPQDAFEYFYQIARFRYGISKYHGEVDRLIKEYSPFSGANFNYYTKAEYSEKIMNLFHKIAREFYETHKKKELDKKAKEKGQSDYDSAPESKKQQIIQDMIDKEMKEAAKDPQAFKNRHMGCDGANTAKQAEGSSKSSKGTGSIYIDGDPGSGDGDGIGGEGDEYGCGHDDDCKPTTKPHGKFNPDLVHEGEAPNVKKVQEMLKTSHNKYVDPQLTEEFKKIIENFTARTKNNSGANARYSGMFDPRQVATRDDWRIFKYKSQGGPIKGYDKLHLNLFIDTSGSYGSNQNKTNTILKSLHDLENQYDFFSFDLVTMQCGETLRSKDERYIQAFGGNRLDKKIWDIYSQLQKPDSFNYNIVLFDGDAFTDCYSNRSEYYPNFGAFNSSKTSIISDADNEAYINKYAPQCHKKIVNHRSSKSYADMLFENILEAFNRALM